MPRQDGRQREWQRPAISEAPRSLPCLLCVPTCYEIVEKNPSCDGRIPGSEPLSLLEDRPCSLVTPLRQCIAVSTE